MTISLVCLSVCLSVFTLLHACNQYIKALGWAYSEHWAGISSRAFWLWPSIHTTIQLLSHSLLHHLTPQQIFPLHNPSLTHLAITPPLNFQLLPHSTCSYFPTPLTITPPLNLQLLPHSTCNYSPTQLVITPSPTQFAFTLSLSLLTVTHSFPLFWLRVLHILS